MSVDIILDQHLATLTTIYGQLAACPDHDIIDLTILPPPLTILHPTHLTTDFHTYLTHDPPLLPSISTLTAHLQAEHYRWPDDDSSSKQVAYISPYTQTLIDIINQLAHIAHQHPSPHHHHYTTATTDIITHQLQPIIQRMVHTVCGSDKNDITVQCTVYSNLHHICDRMTHHQLHHTKLYTFLQHQCAYIVDCVCDTVHGWMGEQWQTVVQQTNHNFIQKAMPASCNATWYTDVADSSNTPLLSVLRTYVHAMSVKFNGVLHGAVISQVLTRVAVTVLTSYAQHVVGGPHRINQQAALQLKHHTQACIALLIQYNSVFASQYQQLCADKQYSRVCMTCDDKDVSVLLEQIRHVQCITYVMLHTTLFMPAHSQLSCMSIGGGGGEDSRRVMPMPRLDVVQYVTMVLGESQVQQVVQCVSDKHADQFDRSAVSSELY